MPWGPRINEKAEAAPAVVPGAHEPGLDGGRGFVTEEHVLTEGEASLEAIMLSQWRAHCQAPRRGART